MAFCYECGSTIKKDDLFCNQCGKQVKNCAQSIQDSPLSQEPVLAPKEASLSAKNFNLNEPVAPQSDTRKDSMKVVMVASTKSAGVSLLLTLFLGPIGLLYSSISGGIIMLIVDLIFGLMTFGMILFVTWPITMIWGVMAVNSHNKKLMESAVA